MAEEQAELPTEEQDMEEEQQTSEKDDESEEGESDDEEYFEVEKIMARKKRDGVFLYRVRWKGYPPSNDTWEPVDNLEVVADMVEEYDAKEEQKAKARQEERRIRKLRMEGKKLPGEESSDSSNSSDDERLLNEDTKFFKMLEKNKDIVFGQPDLYSKVKSRAATLASKKKNEENKAEASAAKSRSSQAQSSKDSNRRSGRGRLIKSAVEEKKPSRGKTAKKSLSEDSESDDSPVRQKTVGRSRRRQAKKLTSESSEEMVESDDSAPLKTISGRGRSRQQKKLVIEDSENGEDSDDSLPLVRQTKRRQGALRQKSRIVSSEDNTPDRSPVHEMASDSSGKIEPAKKAQSKQTAAPKKQPCPADKKESEKSPPDSEIDKSPNLFSKFEKTSLETITRKPYEKVSSPDQCKGDKLEQKLTANASDSPKDLTAKSSSDKTSSFPTPVQPRVIVPVLEKLAQSSLTLMDEEDLKKNSDGKKTIPVPSRRKDEELKNCQEKTFPQLESMEVEVSEKKQDGKGGKKKSSSRKRKLDSASEHARAVSEGQASPLKSSPVSPSSPRDTPASASESNPPVLSLEINTHETTHHGMDSDDVTANISPPILQKSITEKKVPPLRITVPNLKIGPPKLKAESLRPNHHHHHSPKSQAASSKEKQKSKSDGMKTTKHDRHSSASTAKTSQSSKHSPSRESALESAQSVTFLNSSPVQTGSTPSLKKDSSKSASDVNVSHQQISKSDITAKTAKTSTSEPVYVKTDSVSSRTTVDRTDQKLPRTDDSKRKYSSSSDFSSSSVSVSKDTVFSTYTPSSVRDSQNFGRDSLLSTSRNTSGIFSSASTSRDTSSLYSNIRDPSLPGRGVPSVRDPSHLSSYKDHHLTPGSGRDLHLGSGSSGDIRLGAGYIHLSSGSSRESSFSVPSSRDSHYTRSDPKEGCVGGSRHNLNCSISGKENADRQHGVKSLSSVPKKGDGVHPLDTILNSSLYAGDGDKSRQFKGLDSDFELALQRIDLEYLEKLLLPPVTPMELSDEELRQAVMDGNCYLVERALACSKPYNMNLPDNKGYTLLMNAVLRGSDDIIVHLLSGGADAQVQVNGITALMLAVEHAESSTVFMLLEMGAHVNTADHSGETALFKAVRRGDKHILKLILDHGANFSLTSCTGFSPLQMAKQFRLTDVETTLIDHIQRVVRSFEEQVNLTVRGTAKLVSCLFPHHCVPLYESDTITIPFKYQPSMPAGPGHGCLLFIAHARFSSQDIKCRLYGQCAVERVTLNEVIQPCLTEESNFVLMCHPLITGWNELVIHTKRDPMSKAKLIVCAYKAQLIYK